MSGIADISHGLHVRGGIVGHGLHPLAIQYDERLFLVDTTDSIVGLEDDGLGEVYLVNGSTFTRVRIEVSGESIDATSLARVLMDMRLSPPLI